MPIYEYRCHKCGQTIEITQKFSDRPLRRCPSCSGKVTKIISNCSFHLKGTGWYVTDYKQKELGRGKEKQAAPKNTETVKSDLKKSEEKKS